MLGEFGSAWGLYRNASANRPQGGVKGAFLRVYPLRGIFQRVSHQTFSHISRMFWLLLPLVVRYTWNSVYHAIENVQWHIKKKSFVYAFCAPADSGFTVSNLRFMISLFHLLRQLSWSHFAFWLYTDQWSEVHDVKAIAVSEFLYFHMLWIWFIVLLGCNEHVQYKHILKNTISVVLDLWRNYFLGTCCS